MVIEAIDGETIAADKDPAQFLNRKAGKKTLLRVADGDKRVDVVVKPITLGEENRLLYARWVRRNQEEVDRLSQGQLGLHPRARDERQRLPLGLRRGHGQVRRRARASSSTPASTAAATWWPTWPCSSAARSSSSTRATGARSGYEPNFRWTKPSISMANEANYSDGHCYAYTVKALNLGKLVGMPTPGTCTFAGWESARRTASGGACRTAA